MKLLKDLPLPLKEGQKVAIYPPKDVHPYFFNRYMFMFFTWGEAE